MAFALTAWSSYFSLVKIAEKAHRGLNLLPCDALIPQPFRDIRGIEMSLKLIPYPVVALQFVQIEIGLLNDALYQFLWHTHR
jgi:hypothetical protein